MTDPTLLVLASLADGDKHGYAIMTDVKAFAGVPLRRTVTYRIETRGHIKALPADDRRRPYRLTPAGRQHLQAQLNALEPIVRAGIRRLRPS